MKVVFDISLLGLTHGQFFYGGRRFAEVLALELARSGECELFFSATHSLKILNRTFGYLKDHVEFANTALLTPKLTIKAYHFYHQWVHSIMRPQHPGLISKVVRRSLSESLKWTDRVLSPLGKIPVKHADIFHSYLFPSRHTPQGHARLRRIVTVNNLLPTLNPIPSTQLDLHLNRKLLKWVNPRDWIVCISQTVKNDLCNFLEWIDPNRVCVTYLGASEIFRPCRDQREIDSVRKKYNIPEGPFLLAFNQYRPFKNALLVVQAFKVLVQEEHLKDLSLVLVGGSPYPDAQIADFLKPCKEIEEKVIFTGFVSDQDLALLYSGALIFIFPSLFEGFGLPLLEAMQCGAPVITANTTSLPEVVGKAGIMIDPTRADELCQAVLKIYRDREYRKKLMVLSFAQAKKFSWEKCIRETLDTYKMALSHN